MNPIMTLLVVTVKCKCGRLCGCAGIRAASDYNPRAPLLLLYCPLSPPASVVELYLPCKSLLITAARL